MLGDLNYTPSFLSYLQATQLSPHHPLRKKSSFKYCGYWVSLLHGSVYRQEHEAAVELIMGKRKIRVSLSEYSDRSKFYPINSRFLEVACERSFYSSKNSPTISKLIANQNLIGPIICLTMKTEIFLPDSCSYFMSYEHVTCVSIEENVRVYWKNYSGVNTLAVD